MKRSSLISRITLLAVLFAFATACKTSKTESNKYQPATTNTHLASRYEKAVEAWQPQWEGVTVPVSVSTPALPVSLSGTAVMLRGKFIYLSLRVLGMEQAVALITPDSMTMVDKHNGRHICCPLDKITKQFPVTIANLQDILFGRAFIAGQDECAAKTTQKSFNIVPDDSDGWYLLPSEKGGVPFDYAFVFNNTDNLESTVVSLADDRAAILSYYKTESTDGYGKMAKELTVQTGTEENVSSAKPALTVKWKLDKARFSNTVTAPAIRIPASSKPIQPETLFKSLGLRAGSTIYVKRRADNR